MDNNAESFHYQFQSNKWTRVHRADLNNLSQLISNTSANAEYHETQLRMQGCDIEQVQIETQTYGGPSSMHVH